MAFITFIELIDAVLMSLVIGYIFYPYFARFNNFRKHNAYEHSHPFRRKFNKSDFLFSIYLIAPAVILHELGHKIVAVALGHDATFFAALSLNKLVNGLPFFDFAAILMIIAIVMASIGSMFLFFVPAYVAFSSTASPLETSIIAFAGPGLNLFLWLIPALLVKRGLIPHKYLPFTILTSRVNMLLFIFNMLPIPGFDGFHVFRGIFGA